MDTNTQAWTSSANSLFTLSSWRQHYLCFLYSQNNWAIVADLMFWSHPYKLSGWNEKPALFLEMKKCSQQQWEWWERSVWAECLRNSGEYGGWGEVGFAWGAVIWLPKAFNPPQHELSVSAGLKRDGSREITEASFASVCVQWVDCR